MDPDRFQAQALARPERFAAALVQAVNEFTRWTPAPRTQPFFGLDLPEGSGTRLLDRLSDLGIFRFYERVIELGSGIGGAARWLARRRGCRVVGVDSIPANVAGAGTLIRRSHLEGQVSLVRSRLEDLPVATATFTHGWSVEALHRETNKAAVFREAFRVIRPGGHLAVQDWVVRGSSPARLRVGEWSFEPLAAYDQALRAAGFTDVRSQDAAELQEEPSAVAEILKDRVRELLGGPEAATGAEAASALHARREAARRGELVLVQLFANKPA